MERKTGSDAKSEQPGWGRHLFMIIVSAIIIAGVIIVTVKYSKTFYGVSATGTEAVIPFATCLVGVLLFLMGVSRRKRERWSLRDYIGDHCYRIAQAFAYLFLVLWAWTKAGSNVELSGIPPNILGFLVGFFILRVERAMESWGRSSRKC